MSLTSPVLNENTVAFSFDGQARRRVGSTRAAPERQMMGRIRESDGGTREPSCGTNDVRKASIHPVQTGIYIFINNVAPT